MEHPSLIPGVIVLSVVVLVMGASITILAFRAYRRTGSPMLKSFATGFALVTLGLLAGSGLYPTPGVPVLTGVLVQRVLIAFGFGLLLYSLYARYPDTDSTKR